MPGKGFWRRKNDRKRSIEKQELQISSNRQTIIDKALEFGYTRLCHPSNEDLDFAILNGSTIIQRVMGGINTWTVEIFGQRVSKYEGKSALEILEALNTSKPCLGNSDTNFLDLNISKLSAVRNDNTIRHVTCQQLIPKSSMSQRCDVCIGLRAILRKMVSRISEQNSRTEERSATDSCTPLFSLTKDELRQRCMNLKEETNSLKYKLCKAKNLISATEVAVSDSVNNTINAQLAANPLPEGTLAHLFIEEQRKYAKNNGRGMRWHPMIIRWALTLHSRSKSAYRAIVQPGFVNLPSERTLYEYYHYRQYSAGVDVQGIREFAKTRAGQDFSLLIDEMKIKEGIVYSERSGEMTGYIAVGDLQSELEQLKNSSQVIATHALVMLIRGIKKPDTFAAATFFTKGATASQLYFMVWETISYLELVRLQTRVLVCDGATANRSFAQLHKACQSTDELVYRTPNRFKPERWLYFISDAPHLMKTTRNCIENSGGNLNSRNLVLHGQPITWGQLTSLHEETATSTGLVMLHKLTSGHTNLTSYTRMKVKFAVQMLSSSVANALQLKKDERLSSTIELVRKMDTVFDILNVKAYGQGIRVGNTNRMEISSAEDPRFEWIEQQFLKWLADWELEVSSIPDLTPAERSRCLLSAPTRKGWEMTCRSFIALAKELLDEGYKYILSEHLTCQDPVEQYFAKQRDSTGGNAAPSTKEFLTNNLLFQVTKQTAVTPTTGNTSTDRHVIEIDNTPVSKRLKK